MDRPSSELGDARQKATKSGTLTDGGVVTGKFCVPCTQRRSTVEGVHDNCFDSLWWSTTGTVEAAAGSDPDQQGALEDTPSVEAMKSTGHEGLTSDGGLKMRLGPDPKYKGRMYIAPPAAMGW